MPCKRTDSINKRPKYNRFPLPRTPIPNVSTGSHCVQGFRQCSGPTDFDHMIHADLAGQSKNVLVPVRSSLVIDDFIAPNAGTRGIFLVTTRSRNDAGAVHLGELKGKDGNAARAKDENRRPRFDLSEIHQRVPCRYGGTGQGRSFLVAEVVRNTNQTILIKRAIFTQDAVQIPASERRSQPSAGSPPPRTSLA